MSNDSLRRRARGVTFACTVLVPLALAAPAFAATTPTTTPFQKAFTTYRKCMAKHGVKLAARPRNGNGTPDGSRPAGQGTGSPGGGFGGNGVPRNLPKGVSLKKYQAAQKACQSKLRGNGFGANSGQFQAYLSCLRDHGVNVPQAGSSGGGLSQINRNDPAFQAANQICGQLLPQRGPGAPPTSSPTGAASA